MQLDEKDLSYLIDIFECISDIRTFTKEMSYYQFENNKMCKLAVERQLEVIGQAANNISKITQEKLSRIPWGLIIGLRNKLAHDYGEILVQRIWEITKKPINELYEEIIQIDEIQKYSKNRNVT
jgi:uncharacterized protein with HEPN domain